MTIGEFIQNRRKAIGLTQRQLGEAIGFSKASGERMVQFWEHNERRPDIDQLRPLCRALGCTLEELIPRE